jgi:hypothetical protein
MRKQIEADTFQVHQHEGDGQSADLIDRVEGGDREGRA